MKIIYLVLLFLPLMAQAKYIASGGAEVATGLNSSSVDSSILPGVRGEIEYGHASFPRFTVFSSIAYFQGPGKVQYDYTDPDDLNNTQIDNVQTKVSVTRLNLGLRMKLIEQKDLSLYAGAGFMFGALNLNLDRGNFKGKAGPSDDFEQNEHKNFRGYFGELGGEMKLNQNFGVRLSGQISTATTNTFEILDDSKVSFSQMSVALSYLWYIN
ncbi:MAG: outer membrane beta-barrel protein [Bdellovibrionota bacterium]